MMSVKGTFLILVFTLAMVIHGGNGTDFKKFAACVTSDIGWDITWKSDVHCAIGKMTSAYVGMLYRNCKKCDPYFHCIGNYNAVYMCGSTDLARRTAEAISNCREFSQGGLDSDDGMADNDANLYGRYGGNCAERYLCSVRCCFNPQDKSCDSSNCP